MPTTVERFMLKTEIADDGCWRWTGALYRLTGYAAFSDETRRMTYAHRWAYEHYVGPIPDGCQVDHLCHNRDASCPGGPTCLHRQCANPDHLRAVIQRDNMRACVERRGTCRRGHKQDSDNVYVDRRGYRTCLDCVQITNTAKKGTST